MNTGDFFSRFLFYSLCVHIVIFGYIIFDPLSGVFLKKNVHIKSAIRVDTIGLPELKRRMKTPNKSEKKSLPKKVVKKKKPTKKVVKKKKAPPTVKVKKKKVSEKKDKKDLKKEQSEAMERIKEIENIEQKQNQAIDKLEAMESIEKMKKELEEPKYAGEAISKGNAQEGEAVTDFQMLQYFTSIRAHINMYWNLPQELADKNFRAEIYTVINNGGQVLEMRVIKSSGNEDFDARVLETISRASPLPKPPTKEIEKLLLGGVVFKFPE